MFSKEVTDKDGQKHTVFASTEDQLVQAASNVEGASKPTYPNINHPVAKGHDLVETQDDMSTKLVDGTGAHNSPNDAVQSDGKSNSDVTVKGMDEPEYKTQGDPGNVRDREKDAQEARDGEGTSTEVQGSENTTVSSDTKSDEPSKNDEDVKNA